MQGRNHVLPVYTLTDRSQLITIRPSCFTGFGERIALLCKAALCSRKVALHPGQLCFGRIELDGPILHRFTVRVKALLFHLRKGFFSGLDGLLLFFDFLLQDFGFFGQVLLLIAGQLKLRFRKFFFAVENLDGRSGVAHTFAKFALAFKLQSGLYFSFCHYTAPYQSSQSGFLLRSIRCC